MTDLEKYLFLPFLTYSLSLIFFYLTDSSFISAWSGLSDESITKEASKQSDISKKFHFIIYHHFNASKNHKIFVKFYTSYENQEVGIYFSGKRTFLLSLLDKSDFPAKNYRPHVI